MSAPVTLVASGTVEGLRVLTSPTVTDWIGACIASLLLFGTFLSGWLVYRGYRLNQLLGYVATFEKQAYFTRFWAASIAARRKVLLVGPFEPPVQFWAYDGGPLAIPPRGPVGNRIPIHKDDDWYRVLADMLGPGFTTDASRADLVNFRALSERVGYWIGIDSRWPRWVKARRARQVLRVFGDQLTVTIHRHRVVAAHMVSLSAASAGPVLEVQTWNYKYYPKSYGLFDPSYRSLLTLLFDASKTKEFGAMGQGTEQLESFERSLEAADWPEELRQEWRA